MECLEIGEPRLPPPVCTRIALYLRSTVVNSVYRIERRLHARTTREQRSISWPPRVTSHDRSDRTRSVAPQSLYTSVCTVYTTTPLGYLLVWCTALD